MMDDEHQHQHQQFFKNNSLISPQNRKSRIREEADLLRKGNRANLFSTRRFCQIPSNSITSNVNYTESSVKQIAKEIQKKSCGLEDHLKYLRIAFSHSGDFVKAFLEVSNALHALVGYLTGRNSTLQLEAAWCITNLSANFHHDDIMQVVKSTAPYLITYLQNGSSLLQDQSAIALGNMASSNNEVRELLLEQGILHPLMTLCKTLNHDVAQSAVFALCNVIKSRELVAPSVMMSDLPFYFINILRNHKTDIYFVSEIAWLFTYLTCDEENIDVFIEGDVANEMIHWMSIVRPHQKEFYFVVTPLIRCLGNIIGSSSLKLNVNRLLSSEHVFMTLNNLLLTNKRYLIKECLWLIGNIFARKDLSISEPLDNVEMMISNVKRHLASAYEIKKESVICIHNIASCSSYTKFTFDNDTMASLIDILKLRDVEIVYLALRCVEFALHNKPEVTTKLFLTLDGPSYLEALSYNENEDIRVKSVYLLETYYENDGDS